MITIITDYEIKVCVIDDLIFHKTCDKMKQIRDILFLSNLCRFAKNLVIICLRGFKGK